jgi:molybdopterin converting factor subunit 1
MKVLFFAQSREIAGSEFCELKTDSPLTQLEFWTLLIGAYPGLARHRKTARLARNETYLQGDELLQPDDEIAIIPPVSGG